MCRPDTVFFPAVFFPGQRYEFSAHYIEGAVSIQPLNAEAEVALRTIDQEGLLAMALYTLANEHGIKLTEVKLVFIYEAVR